MLGWWESRYCSEPHGKNTSALYVVSFHISIWQAYCSTYMFQRQSSQASAVTTSHVLKVIAGLQLMEQHKKASLPSSSLTEVCLMVGDMKEGLGLYTDAHHLWQQALQLSQQECSAVGLKERQVKLVNCCSSVHCLG